MESIRKFYTEMEPLIDKRTLVCEGIIVQKMDDLQINVQYLTDGRPKNGRIRVKIVQILGCIIDKSFQEDQSLRR